MNSNWYACISNLLPLASTRTVSFANDQRHPTNDGNKKPRAGFPDTGLVSLTMTCLRDLVMNAEQFFPSA